MTHYELVIPGDGITVFGLVPDKLISKHKTIEAANRALDRQIGPHAIDKVENGVRTRITATLC